MRFLSFSAAAQQHLFFFFRFHAPVFIYPLNTDFVSKVKNHTLSEIDDQQNYSISEINTRHNYPAGQIIKVRRPPLLPTTQGRKSLIRTNRIDDHGTSLHVARRYFILFFFYQRHPSFFFHYCRASRKSTQPLAPYSISFFHKGTEHSHICFAPLPSSFFHSHLACNPPNLATSHHWSVGTAMAWGLGPFLRYHFFFFEILCRSSPFF